MRFQQSKRRTVVVVSPDAGQCPVMAFNSGKVTISDDYHNRISIGKKLLKKTCSL